MRPGTKPWTGDEDDALTRGVAAGNSHRRDRRQDRPYSVRPSKSSLRPSAQVGPTAQVEPIEAAPEGGPLSSPRRSGAHALFSLEATKYRPPLGLRGMLQALRPHAAVTISSPAVHD